jgi:hypothetical protein
MIEVNRAVAVAWVVPWKKDSRCDELEGGRAGRISLTGGGTGRFVTAPGKKAKPQCVPAGTVPRNQRHRTPFLRRRLAEIEIRANPQH